MGLLRELKGLATHIALYPLGFLPGSMAPIVPPASASDAMQTPVVLVHGYFHNRSGFFFLARALRKRGFRWVYAMNYNPLGASVPALARRLARHVDDVRAMSGASKVHVVGHSLGGVIARWYVDQLDGAQAVDTCVTIGTPHRGTMLAYLGPGQTAREMRPSSDVVGTLQASVSPDVHYLNLYSDLDVLVVPASSAIMPEAPNVENRLVSDLGHTSLLISPELIAVVADQLEEAEAAGLAEITQLSERRQASGS